ncbi:endonuclease III [Candidatus Magnetoovum chiemensis]|nr:endonuclease III [Candidatus Magnetoovum chiemensis]
MPLDVCTINNILYYIMDKQYISNIINTLRQKYPSPKTALYYTNPLELLIATILSAQCTDIRVNEVTKTLFDKYKTVYDYANAQRHSFEQEIKSTGFYKNKAEKIIECSNELIKEFSAKVPQTMDELIRLPGVGRKTASVVLACAYSIPAIAVDTHVLRVTQRLGLVSTKNADRAEAALKEIIPREDWIFFSLSVILFGRGICKSRKPLCGKCFLFDFCSWDEKRNYL